MVDFIVLSAPGTVDPVKEITVGRTPNREQAEKWCAKFKGRIVEVPAGCDATELLKKVGE